MRGEPAASPGRRTKAGHLWSTRSISLGTIALFFIAWTLVAYFRLVSPVFLPSPLAVLWKFYTVATSGFVDATLWQHLSASLLRVFAALFFSLLVAIPVGIAIGISRIGRGIFDPILEFLRPIPPLAYLPLVIIWFGIGEPSKILVIAIAMLAPIAISTASGVRGVSHDRINAAKTLGASNIQLVLNVILPSATPSILTGLRIALGTGWTTLVAAELVAATRGLGFMIQSAAQFLVTDVVIMGIFTIAIIAFILEVGLRRLERWLVPWSGRE
ncbi:ABC transporter permease subunit [Phyllobacterium sp. YR531]|uniref:ABC transporter permease subunit n=1 Tax=Phyllobacterium sp. YR531 TaxID=1144343 RepID=UPI001FCBC47B|nr:ABC transporter permease subunit [Phyllobacterium sp. YR531]